MEQPKYKIGQPIIYSGLLGIINKKGYITDKNVTPPATIHLYGIDWITTADKPSQDLAYDEVWVDMMVNEYNRRLDELKPQRPQNR